MQGDGRRLCRDRQLAAWKGLMSAGAMAMRRSLVDQLAFDGNGGLLDSGFYGDAFGGEHVAYFRRQAIWRQLGGNEEGREGACDRSILR